VPYFPWPCNSLLWVLITVYHPLVYNVATDNNQTTTQSYLHKILTTIIHKGFSTVPAQIPQYKPLTITTFKDTSSIFPSWTIQRWSMYKTWSVNVKDSSKQLKDRQTHKHICALNNTRAHMHAHTQAHTGNTHNIHARTHMHNAHLSSLQS